ncbi:imm11 family protein [Phytohabitans rumicis]|uniref:Uncharacterized protein n=1 Tax=Phytohabitans rumicis TaxID=1076125 RepID=A0A6V8LG18_9ACTN|nr:DUF1629 domain-containing protein [Phytohabitans rumicis]GFJ93818.1 hypothetical protein Prum_074600 [Phytohabitans rumicis]
MSTNRTSPPQVYEPEVEEGFEWALPLDGKHALLFGGFDGTPRAGAWSPVPMYLLRSDEGGPRRRADLPWLGSHVLILRDEAIAEVGPILADHGELLPLECADAGLVVLNVTRVVDALDEERSDIVRFSSGRIMDIKKATFRGELLTGPAVFKIPQMPFGPLYFTSDTVELIRATGRHRGVTFRPA